MYHFCMHIFNITLKKVGYFEVVWMLYLVLARLLFELERAWKLLRKPHSEWNPVLAFFKAFFAFELKSSLLVIHEYKGGALMQSE